MTPLVCFTISPPGFKLRFNQSDHFAGFTSKPVKHHWQNIIQRNEGDVDGHEINRFRQALKLPSIGMFHDHNERIVTQGFVQFPLPNINGIDFASAILKQTVGKPACGSAYIGTNFIQWAQLKMF